MLTAVPKRGRMVDTKTYIKNNLQAYADDKFFAFTRTIDSTKSKVSNSQAKASMNMAFICPPSVTKNGLGRVSMSNNIEPIIKHHKKRMVRRYQKSRNP